jgi:hypothetical protein
MRVRSEAWRLQVKMVGLGSTQGLGRSRREKNNEDDAFCSCHRGNSPGTWYVGEGERFDAAKLKGYPAGSFHCYPGRHPSFRGDEGWSSRSSAKRH